MNIHEEHVGLMELQCRLHEYGNLLQKLAQDTKLSARIKIARIRLTTKSIKKIHLEINEFGKQMELSRQSGEIDG